MTIDEHIEVLKSYHNGFTGYAGNLQNSIDVAIDTMQKYQKIKNIWNKWYLDMQVKSEIAMTELGEVLENGNDS